MAGNRGEAIAAAIARRRDFVEYLAGEPRTQAAVAAALDVSRSTVTRAMQELQAAELVARVDGQYRTTRLGEVVLETYERYHSQLSELAAAEGLFENLSPEAPFESWLLTEGTYYPVQRGASFRVRERVNEQFREATRIVGMGRTRSERESADVYRQKVIEEDRPVENVLSVDLYEHIRNLDWAAEFFGAENLDVYVLESVPYGLFVIDRPQGAVMVMVVYDADDAMKGVLLGETPSIRAWARDVYESYRAAATPLAEFEG